MRTHALALARDFQIRHRWGLVALAAYLVVLATIRLLVLDPARPVDLEAPERFAAVVVVPLTATFTWFLAVFTYGLDGDIAARRSIYPARLFTLPVTNAALAGWPMLLGAVAMTVLWFATRLFAVWPANVDVPWIWPALMASVLLAWTQALTWMPYGLPGFRVVVAVLWLAAIDAVMLLALQFKAREPVMLAILAPQLPLAFLVARCAVSRARRGEVPDWRVPGVGLGRVADLFSSRSERFPSPERAQAWFEFQRHGRSLPSLVGLLLPFELALLFLAGNTSGLVFAIMFGALLTPPFMAAFVAATVRQSNPHVRDALGVSPFIATRPLTSTSLVAAKLKATIWSTLAAWLLVLVAVPLALILSGSWPVVADRVRELSEAVGWPRASAFAVLVLIGLVVATWKQLVQSLYVGLSGREWVVRASLLLTLVLLVAIGPLINWIVRDREVRAVLWSALPWVFGVLVAVKISAAAWIAPRLQAGRLVSDRTLVAGAACWFVCVLALYGVLAWLFSAPLIARYFLGLVAILAVPLARVSAAPLALAWNRHR